MSRGDVGCCACFAIPQVEARRAGTHPCFVRPRGSHTMKEQSSKHDSSTVKAHLQDDGTMSHSCM
jgi:hypothetical protein